MSSSASILFEKGKSIPIYSIMEDTNTFCKHLGLFYSISCEQTDEKNRLKHVCANVSDIPFEESSSRQLIITFFDEPYKYKEISFDWNNQEEVFFEAIVINGFFKNEDLLLMVIYEYLKTYQNAKLWVEEEWFYTQSDLQKITNRSFDNEWCYKNPLYL